MYYAGIDQDITVCIHPSTAKLSCSDPTRCW